MKPNRDKNIITTGNIHNSHKGVTYTNTANRATGHIISAKIDGQIDYHAFFHTQYHSREDFFLSFSEAENWILEKIS